MPLNLPTDPKQLEDRSLADLARELPNTANPFLEESWMGAQAIANARRAFEFYQQLGLAELESIPVTADQKLELWASFWGIVRIAATQAGGNVIVLGNSGAIINVGDELQSTDGQVYTAVTSATISDEVSSIQSITSAGTTATATLVGNLSMYEGFALVISGADQAEYNGAFDISPISENQFTYELPASAASPATGTIIAEYTSAVIEVVSDGFGQTTNQKANSPLTFSTPIANVENTAYVDFGEIGGGTDQETIESLRERLLDRVQNPVALFNVAAIVTEARKVAGVTDVTVYEITPDVGQVTVYFVRANDANPIPSGSEVQDVKDQILTIKPAHVADVDVIVEAPTPVPVDFLFDNLSPNTPSMQTAVRANIEAVFIDQAVTGQVFPEDRYRSAIINTIDPSNGAQVDSFSLLTPVGDIGGGADEYPLVNSVTF